MIDSEKENQTGKIRIKTQIEKRFEQFEPFSSVNLYILLYPCLSCSTNTERVSLFCLVVSGQNCFRTFFFGV